MLKEVRDDRRVEARSRRPCWNPANRQTSVGADENSGIPPLKSTTAAVPSPHPGPTRRSPIAHARHHGLPKQQGDQVDRAVHVEPQHGSDGRHEHVEAVVVAELELGEAQVARRVDPVLDLRGHREMPGHRDLVVKPPAESGRREVGGQRATPRPTSPTGLARGASPECGATWSPFRDAPPSFSRSRPEGLGRRAKRGARGARRAPRPSP